MKIKANYHIKPGKKTIQPGEVADMNEKDALHCIRSGSAVEYKGDPEPQKPPPSVHTQDQLEKMTDADLKKIADTFKVPGGKKEDVIKGILESQKQAK